MNILILLLIPFLTSAALLILSRKYTQTIAVVSSVVSVAVSGIMIAMYYQNPITITGIDLPWIPSMGTRFHLSSDGVSLLMALITNVVVMVSMYVTLSENKAGQRQFYALLLLMQTFILGVFVAEDMFLYYIFWELSLIPAYFLVLLWGESPKIKPITLRFFLFTLFGSLLMLIAIITLGNMGEVGNYDLSIIEGLEIGIPTQLLLFVAFMVAFGIKSPIFPLHGWQADTYEAAPTSVTIILSGVMSKMAIYSIYKFVLPILPDAVNQYGSYVVLAATFGVFYASLLAMVQTNIKRMFAYVSMAHMGIIAAGLFTLNSNGLHGVMLQIAAHAVNTCGLFLVAHSLYKLNGSHDMASFGGLRQKMPLFAGAFLVILFGVISVPFTNGFIGEFLILNSLYSYDVLSAILAGSGVILGAVYMLNLYKRVILGKDNKTNYLDINDVDKFLYLSLVFVIIITGVYSSWITKLCDASIQTILHSNYIQ